MYQKKSTRGFTFVELMVSIAIIGVLSAVVLSGVDRVRKNARVAQRVSDLKRVQSALDLYYAKNRSYPVTGGAWRGVCASYSAGGTYTANNGLVIPGLAPTYIPRIPVDPQGSPSSDYNCYLYRSGGNPDGTDYAFLVHAVTELSDGSSGASYAKYPEFYDSNRPTWAWKVSSPGGTGF